jgi:hypothetical protein
VAESEKQLRTTRPYLTEDRAAAIDLLRHTWVRFNHEAETGPDRMVVCVHPSGMIEILGMVGKFAPHLFVKVDPPTL